jgi:TRAP-type C4-dicarboxylate transport system substrate-binding protein
VAGPLPWLITRGRALNWIALFETARFIYKHGKQRWDNLTPDERRRIGELVRKSKGRRSNLTERERDRLWALVKKAMAS